MMKEANKRRLYSKKIYKELRLRGMNASTVAHTLRVVPAAVSAVITGKNDSCMILDYLRFIGISEEYLCDPRIHRNVNGGNLHD